MTAKRQALEKATDSLGGGEIEAELESLRLDLDVLASCTGELETKLTRALSTGEVEVFPHPYEARTVPLAVAIQERRCTVRQLIDQVVSLRERLGL